MKKRKIFAIGLIASIMGAAVGFSACEQGQTESHEHTYATGWTKTDTHHYHAATCEHTDEKKDEGAHEYDDENDAVCKVCGYERTVHEHTYTAEWTKTDTHHYHAATCGHTNEKKDEGAHDTTGANGVCSVCGYYSVFVITASSQSEEITATVEEEKSLRIEFTGTQAGYYVFTNTGNVAIGVSWSCGEDIGDEQFIQSGEDFTVKISDTNHVANILIANESQTKFTVTLTNRYSEENPDEGWTDFH